MWESIYAFPAVPRSDLLIATPIDLSFRCVLLQMWTCEMRATAEDSHPGETGGAGGAGGAGGWAAITQTTCLSSSLPQQTDQTS